MRFAHRLSEWGRFLVHSPKEAVRLRLVYVCLKILKHLGPKELSALNSRVATEMAVNLSISGVQIILDREGIAHCAFCASRFSLQRIGKSLVCKSHVGQAREREAQAESVGAPR